MRILLSIVLVFGIVAGLGEAFRGPRWYGRHAYAYGYGPCGAASYGPPAWNGAWWGGAPPTPPPAPPAATSTPATPSER